MKNGNIALQYCMMMTIKITDHVSSSLHDTSLLVQNALSGLFNSYQSYQSSPPAQASPPAQGGASGFITVSGQTLADQACKSFVPIGAHRDKQTHQEQLEPTIGCMGSAWPSLHLTA